MVLENLGRSEKFRVAISSVFTNTPKSCLQDVVEKWGFGFFVVAVVAVFCYLLTFVVTLCQFIQVIF